MALNLRRMEFVHPEILWGLGALAIPIAIHLLHFRRFRRVRFSQVAFLKAIQRETKATQQIKHWWILLLRLLAFTGLILAFAQPKLVSESSDRTTGNAGHAVSIYVDNSFSMEGAGEEGQLLQSARNKAALIIEQYKPTDQFQVITNEFSGRDQVFLTRDQALERLASIQPVPQAKQLSEVMARAENQLTQSTDRTRSAYLFTDLQKNTHTFAPDMPAPDSSIQWLFVPELAGSTPNIWVDSVWFDEPMRITDRPAALRVRFGHNSKAAVDAVPMALEINGQRVALGTFNLVPGLATDTVLRYTHGAAGIQSGTVRIEDAPIRFDDAWHFGYDVVDRIRVAILSSNTNDAGTRAVERIFETASGLYDVEVRTQWSPGSLTEFHLIALCEWPAQNSGFANAMSRYVQRGGTLVLLPKTGEADQELLKALNLNTGNNWIEAPDRVQDLAVSHPFFDGIFSQTPDRMDLPAVRELWERRVGFNESILATTERGKPFLTRLPFGKGQAFLFSTGVSEEATNLTRHALFVPLLLRMGEQSAAGRVHQGSIGQFDTWELNLDAASAERLTLQGAQKWLPETRQTGGSLKISLGNLSLSAGHYVLTNETASLATLGLNNDRRESDHAAFDPASFESQFTNRGWTRMQVITATSSVLPQVIQQIEQGTPLWKACVILAILALILEALFLRIWKHSSKA